MHLVCRANNGSVAWHCKVLFVFFFGLLVKVCSSKAVLLLWCISTFRVHIILGAHICPTFGVHIIFRWHLSLTFLHIFGEYINLTFWVEHNFYGAYQTEVRLFFVVARGIVLRKYVLSHAISLSGLAGLEVPCLDG